MNTSEDIGLQNFLSIPHAQTDNAWKDLLQVWFYEFMTFFYPEVANKIDWSVGYESLDKELQSITTQAMIGNRIVDKLMKVKTLQEKEFWVLLHTEIQGQKETDFEKRLFQYYYRLTDRYNIPIMTLVILADVNENWRPSYYRSNVCGMEIISFRFFTTKLLDYADKISWLEPISNPFGIVVLAQLAALKTRVDVNERFNAKYRLTRQLYDWGLDRDTILILYKFLDWVLTLPEDLELRYNNVSSA